MDKIYSIYTISLGSKVMYVGCTNRSKHRVWEHLNSREKYATIQSPIPTDVDLSLVSFNVLKEFTSKEEALKEEDRLIVEYDTINNGWNKRRSGLVRKDDPKKYLQEYHKSHPDYRMNWYYNNQEKAKKQANEYYYRHMDEINKKRREKRLKEKNE